VHFDRDALEIPLESEVPMADLRLVTDQPHPIPRKAPPPGLTKEQRGRLSAALNGLHARYGTWRAVANAIGLSESAVTKVRYGSCGSMAMVVRAAELLRIPVERLLDGELADASKCPYCGQTVAGR
jgi:hypothetical protein